MIPAVLVVHVRKIFVVGEDELQPLVVRHRNEFAANLVQTNTSPGVSHIPGVSYGPDSEPT